MEEQTAWGNIAALADKGGMGIAGLEWEDWLVAASTPSPKFVSDEKFEQVPASTRNEPARCTTYTYSYKQGKGTDEPYHTYLR